jgi:hypothetical protein
VVAYQWDVDFPQTVWMKVEEMKYFDSLFVIVNAVWKGAQHISRWQEEEEEKQRLVSIIIAFF